MSAQPQWLKTDLVNWYMLPQILPSDDSSASRELQTHTPVETKELHSDGRCQWKTEDGRRVNVWCRGYNSA